MKTTAQERAERLFQREIDGKQAMTEYQAEQQAVRERTARLRAARLARDAEKEKGRPG
ncbi:MAG TPA: hypothetical protein VFT69_06000 [Pseudolabrys sp.]|jgi:hypothetical protein|nr:hypothetical protein [Pseudolabrys sp.]